MPAAKPWLTTDGLIESIKRKISLPISQVTFSNSDLIRFLNEEMFIGQVPSVLIYHEEFYVYRVEVPLQGKSRFPIPDRSIGMKLRDLMYMDDNGNLYEMTRIQAEDKAFFQVNLGINAVTHKFYVEGNEIVLTPSIVGGAQVGKLVFFIYLRPNQLVRDNRAAICKYFTKDITIDSSVIVAGDKITINDIEFEAVAAAPTGNQFLIDASSVVTATNLVTKINSNGVAIAANGSPSTNIVTAKFDNQEYTIIASNESAFVISTKKGVEFESLPSTWLDEDTKKTEPLFVENSLIDFLQTKPGHRIYKYDIKIKTGSINGSSIQFDSSDLPDSFIVGDYICLANEAIIPQIPPDLHNLLSERAGARVLSSIGDQAGLQMANTKIAEMEKNQGTLIDNRVDGSIEKITGRHSLLRYQSSGWRRRF